MGRVRGVTQAPFHQSVQPEVDVVDGELEALEVAANRELAEELSPAATVT